MIKSFASKAAEAIWLGLQSPDLPSTIQNTTLRKLRLLNQARTLQDLRVPPNNKLHALKRDRAGQFAICVNDQYRLCFRWDGRDAHDVEVADYH